MTELLGEARAELYDRQIRVWGIEAQARMNSSRVLICGMKGLHAEVAKNLVLAGVNVTIQDSTLVDISDLGANCFLRVDDIGKNVAQSCHGPIQALNGYSAVVCETRPVASIDDEFFSQFNVVLLSADSQEEEALRVNTICRSVSPHICFFWSGCFYLDAWFIADFGSSFTYTKDPPNNKELFQISFPSLLDVLEKPWSTIQSRLVALPMIYMQSRVLETFTRRHSRFPLGVGDLDALRSVGRELLQSNGVNPAFLDDRIGHLCSASSATVIMVASVMGGFLAQEVLKSVSHSGEPMYNIVEFCGEDNLARAIPSHPVDQRATNPSLNKDTGGPIVENLL